jgi:hypothetical protein
LPKSVLFFPICTGTSKFAAEIAIIWQPGHCLASSPLFFAKSTFFHVGQREKKNFFAVEIAFFQAEITFFSRWRVQREKK